MHWWRVIDARVYFSVLTSLPPFAIREIYIKIGLFPSEISIRERYEIRKGDIAWNLWKNGRKLRNIDRGNKFIPLVPTPSHKSLILYSKTFLPYLVGEIGSLFLLVIARTRVPNDFEMDVRDNERR